MRTALALLGLGAASGARAGLSVVLTPCADNSFRVQVTANTHAPSSNRRSALGTRLASEELEEMPGAFVDACAPSERSVRLTADKRDAINGNLRATLAEDGTLTFALVDSGRALVSADYSLAPAELAGYMKGALSLRAADADERIYGLGQGGWTRSAGCPSGDQKVVPLVRNGQSAPLLQTKFSVTIPFAYSSAGYGVVFNMPGYGTVRVGELGVGGSEWTADATLGLDFWISAMPYDLGRHEAAPIYAQYADATGHAPPMPDNALLFWQSRNRYKSSAIAMDVAQKYADLGLPVGVLVIDYKNMVHDGDFAPDTSCYPSVADLSASVRASLNASTVFSFWPEVLADAGEYADLDAAGCLINSDLGGRAIDVTIAKCRELVWTSYIKPRYFDQGVTTYWLDETDAEGTAHGGYDPQGSGYDTSFGPAAFASNLWVNQWLRTFTEPAAAAGGVPLVLTRGVWAGGQRHGAVLWSSDIWSTFESLAAMGVHASLSGIPWWTTDVGGYGCGRAEPNDSPYMRELIVRWYQFGLFSPVFRTHGCRNGPSEPDVDPCRPAQGSCGANEVWSYGAEVQTMLERYVRLRASRLAPYMRALAVNVSARGVPTMRPLWWEFPDDADATVGVNDAYMLGPDLLVAPVTVQGATSRDVYLPCADGPGSTRWRSYWNASDVRLCGRHTVDAPLSTIPVFERA